MTKKPTQKRISGLVPVGLARKLDAAAKFNDRSQAAELRVRLEQTFAAEAAGKRTAAASTTTP